MFQFIYLVKNTYNRLLQQKGIYEIEITNPYNVRILLPGDDKETLSSLSKVTPLQLVMIMTGLMYTECK